MTATAKLSQQQIITKAQAELGTLDKESAEARARMVAIRAEVETINSRSQERDTSLRTLRETVQSLVQQHERLSAHDELAKGTLAAGHVTDQVKAAERERRKAEKALQEAQTKAASDEAKDQTRLQALETERLASERGLDDLTRRREAVEQVIRDAQAAMGEGEYQDIVSQVELLKARLAARKTACDSAEKELDDFAAEALQRLVSFPDLQKKVRSQFTFHDVSTHVIEAAIALLSTLIEGGKAADVDMAYLRRAEMHHESLVGLLTLQPQWLWAAFTGSRPEMLLEKQHKLTKLLAVYRESKRVEEVSSWHSK